MSPAKHSVVFSPEAKADTLELYDYIAAASNAERALAYVERLEQKCVDLGLFPVRGRALDDIRKGLRVIDFERSANIPFAVDRKRVTILRVLYGGRDLKRALSK